MDHLRRCQAQVGIPLVPLGLWGDGIPIQWERAESIEHLAMNLPGLSGPHARLRLPLVTIADKHISEHTWDDISEVLAWSFRHCVLGTWPAHRHDGTPWTDEDRRSRGGYAGRHVARVVVARGTLCEVQSCTCSCTCSCHVANGMRNGSCSLACMHLSWRLLRHLL